MEQYDGLFKADDGAALRFFYDARKNEFLSGKHGRPVYDNVLCVEVITPGSKESAPVIELEREFNTLAGLEPRRNEAKWALYGRQIDAFKRGHESADMRGTPISAWPAADNATAATLREFKIYTVEGLAATPDSALKAFGPGGLELREQAKAFLAAADGSADTSALTAENLRLREEVERLKGELTEMNGRLEAALQARTASAETPPPAPPATDTGLGGLGGNVI